MSKEDNAPEFTDEETAWLEKHFKAGKYCVLQVMVPLSEMKKFLETLQSSGVNCVALPNIANEMELMKADTEKPQ